MAIFAKRIVACVGILRDITCNFYLFRPNEIIETRDQFAKVHERLQNYIHELYIQSFKIETTQKHIHDFYNSDGYFSKKEIRAFSGAIGNICNTLHEMHTSNTLGSYDSFNSNGNKLPEFTLQMRLCADVIRMKFIASCIFELFEPLMCEYDKIIKIINDSLKLMDVESTLYT